MEKTFKIITLGCKVNTYESEYMLESLKKSGFIYDDKNPSIIIINTCSVTNNADNKSLKTVRHEKKNNPESILVVCGCSTQYNKEKYQDLGINILLGNRNKSQIVSLINNYIENKHNYEYFNYTRALSFEDMQVSKFTTHTRAFIKIQDGCNNFCSYCIIPFTRGDIRSKDFDKIIEEANILVANAHQEIVLTGIHTGTYHNSGHDLSDLLTELSKIEGLRRIRLSSIEITELDDKFLQTLKNNPKICNHLHIPLQNGSDAILKIMNRKYNTTYFEHKIAEIRKIRPGISITTDCIVGHPYETEKDFSECLDFCQKIAFSKIHVFPYSKRNGTKSSFMPEVNGNIKKDRVQKLLKLSNELEEKYLLSYLNKEVEILTEEHEKGLTVGHTSNYLKVYLSGELKLNTNYLCIIKKYENNHLYGEVLPQ